MRRRLLGTLLWCVLVPLTGLVMLLWVGLRAAVARVERVLMLGGLAVALSMPNPLAAQLSQAALTPDVRWVLTWVLAGLGIVLLVVGLWSPWLRRVRRALKRKGWFIGAGAKHPRSVAWSP